MTDNVQLPAIIEFLQHPKMDQALYVVLDHIQECFERGCFRHRHEVDDDVKPDHILQITFDDSMPTG